MSNKEKHLIVSPETHKKVKKAALDDDLTIWDFVEKLISDYNLEPRQ